jgi:hypothetical protein
MNILEDVTNECKMWMSIYNVNCHIHFGVHALLIKCKQLIVYKDSIIRIKV